MTDLGASPLGHATTYADEYDPGLLFPVDRAPLRAELGLGMPLPFDGADVWNAYELSWLEASGKPQVQEGEEVTEPDPLYLQPRPSQTGYSAGATWEDAMTGIEHVRAWKRTALVSDADWVHHVVRALGWMIPGTVRDFPTAELTDAIAWAASDADG